MAPTTNASMPLSGAIAGTVVATASRSLVARARAAPARRRSLGSLRTDSDEQHQPERGVLGAAERHRDRRDLTGLAGRRAQLEDAEQVEVELFGELGRTGSEHQRVAVGVGRQDRHGDDLHTH